MNNYIKVLCRTNLDEYSHVEWPEYFVVAPQIGDYVQSINNTSSLKIVGITHSTLKYRDINLNMDVVPILIIELNK